MGRALLPKFAWAAEVITPPRLRTARETPRQLRVTRYYVSRTKFGRIRNYHLRELRAVGFKIVSTGTSGISTAFLAEWPQRENDPGIGFLPEYDAPPKGSHETGF